MTCLSHAVMANEKQIRQLSKTIETTMQSAGIPGLAISVAKNGKVLFSEGYGFADIQTHRKVDSNTLFHIASITKTITATSIMQLVEKNQLSLDMPIDKYIDFPLINPNYPQEKITIRQLLNHTSSISDERAYEIDFRVEGQDSNIKLPELLKNYLVNGGTYYSAPKVFLTSKPGTQWSYSNIGYALLGYIVEKVTGESLRKHSAENIFHPLKMNNTYWELRDVPAAQSATPYEVIDNKFVAVKPVGFADWPAGMIRTSVADIGAFAAASANQGINATSRILLATSSADMLKLDTLAGLPNWLTGQGLGWASSNLGGKSLPNHWGGDPGVFTAVYLDPEHKSAVTILMNTSVSPEVREALYKITLQAFDIAKSW
jgi:CubicO group peptidase (beta-lactamase class C family)